VIAGAVMLDVQRSGCPIERTRTVPVGGKKLAEMQGVGPGPAGGGTVMLQPLTTKMPALIGTGTPMTFTRGLGIIGLACPPWAQVTTQFIVNR